LPTQVEQELSNLNLDWRKRVVFSATLEPFKMNRFDCRLKVIASPPEPLLQESQDKIHFKTSELDVVINTKTGLMDRYRVNGIDYLESRAFCPIVIQHNEDAWGRNYTRFRDKIGEFTILDAQASARFSGVHKTKFKPVRVIEDGPVRTVIESVMGYNHSFICQQYKLPKQGTEIEIETRVFWNEKDRMLKLSLPVNCPKSSFLGQAAFGVQQLPADGSEAVAQKWVAVVSEQSDKALTLINDGTYGSDFDGSELRLSLLRSPVYSALTIGDRPLIKDQNRFTPRIDQGERLFRFWVNAGSVQGRLNEIDREAMVQNEAPMALSFFPAGLSVKNENQSIVKLSDECIQLSALKKAENDESLIIRMYEPTGQKRTSLISFPSMNISKQVELDGFEVKTFELDFKKREWRTVNLIEQSE
jgi:alpha-mannosidase